MKNVIFAGEIVSAKDCSFANHTKPRRKVEGFG